MSRSILRFSPFLFVCFLFLSADAAPKEPRRVRQFRPGTINRTGDLPPSRLRSKLETLPQRARLNALGILRKFHFTEDDLPSLETDDEGGLFYVDDFIAAPADGDLPTEGEPVVAQGAIAVDPIAPHLVFHSKPGAPNIIYLDFTGENVTGTAWNNSLGRTVIPALPYSTDSDYLTFSDTEQGAIKRIWQRVAEDFAPFNVDVTTERPALLGTRTAHAVISRSTDANGAGNPSSGSGGVAYVDVFGTSGFASRRPAWAYVNNLGNNEAVVAEAVSHEIGHNLGLSHDGKTDGAEYYSGHGSGQTSWSPLMGSSGTRNVSQWSNGDYYLANNTQDDLAVVAGKVGFRADDHSDSLSAATPLIMNDGINVVATSPETDPANLAPANKGILERNTDVDTFSLSTGNGPISLTINPWVVSTGSRGGNLDISVELRNASGQLILTNNPGNQTGAEIKTNLVAGTYYLSVRNSGMGVPSGSPPSGYSTYGSIGQYFITGTVATATEVLTSTHPTPLWWLIAHGYTNNFETAVDIVGANGLPLWQSYIAGLIPGDPGSRLHLAAARPRNTNATVLSWNPVEGRVYTISSKTNLTAPFAPLIGGARLPATIRSLTNNLSAGAASVFYRLSVEKL